jgi:hypothetical protein
MTLWNLLLVTCRFITTLHYIRGLSWSWSYGSWIYNYMCNQCLSPLQLWVRTPFMMRCTQCNIMWWYYFQWPATGRWFSLYTPVFSTNKTDHHDITEMLLKVALNNIKPNYIIFSSCLAILCWPGLIEDGARIYLVNIFKNWRILLSITKFNEWKHEKNIWNILNRQ